MPLIVIGLSHHSSAVTVREQFAFAEAAVPEALQKLRASGIATEAVILSTCNRVEIYAASDLPEPQAMADLRRFLLEHHNCPDPSGGEIYAYGGQQTLEHLFKVACGLDSMVLGETEILGQLKKAYETALVGQHTGGRLNKAFQKSVQRRQTDSQRNEHPARHCLCRLGRGGTGTQDIQFA